MWHTQIAPPPKKERSWVPPPPQYDAYIRPSLLELWKNNSLLWFSPVIFPSPKLTVCRTTSYDSRQSIFYMVHSTSSIQNHTLDINCNFSILILSTLPALQAILQWVRSDSQCGRLLLGLHDNTRSWQKIPKLTNIYFLFLFLFFIFSFFLSLFSGFGFQLDQEHRKHVNWWHPILPLNDYIYIVTFEDFKCRHSKWQAHQNFAQKKKRIYFLHKFRILPFL